VAALDEAWPDGGLPHAALHEARAVRSPADFAAATGFVAAIAGRLKKPVLWCAKNTSLYGPGLAGIGLPPQRLLIARLHKDKDALAAMEEGLRHGFLGVVIGEVERCDLTASRRLQLAAEKSGVMALLLRQPAQRHADDAISAASRWRIAAAPSAPHIIPQAGRAQWRLDLVRSRYGTTGSWIVEAPDAQGYLHLPAGLDDRGTAQTDLIQRRTG
jgi:protein ImuA